MNLSVISKKLRQFPILFVCGLLTSLVLVILFMRGPRIAQLEAELADLEREWQNIQTNLERSAGLNDDIASLESGLVEVHDRLMKVEEVAINSEFFYDLERETGVNFTRFSQGMASNGNSLNTSKDELRHFSVIPYDISLSGSMRQILGFLDTLDRQNYIIRLELVNISRSQELMGANDTLNSRLNCYVLAEKHE